MNLFYFEKRKAWFRTSTHTVVRDRDPDFEEFRQATDGVIATLVRIWLRGDSARGGTPGPYVGSLQLCARWGLATHEVRKVLRRLTDLAPGRGIPAATLRRELLVYLRGEGPRGKCA